MLKADDAAIAADTAAISQGATLTIVHHDTQSGANTFALSIPSLGISGLTLGGPSTDGSFAIYTASLSGGREIDLLTRLGDQMAYGYWLVLDPSVTSNVAELSGFITGFRTPSLDSLESSHATASYSGGAAGFVFLPDGSTWKGANLSGSALLNVDFGSGAVTGSYQNVTATPILGNNAASTWNNVSFTGNVAGTGFTGQATASAPSQGGEYQLAAGATGHIDGAFYGANANEAGAVWSLSDGTGAAIGAFGLSQPSSGGGSGVGSGGASVSVGAVNTGSGSGIQVQASAGIQATSRGTVVVTNTVAEEPAASAGGPDLTGLNAGAAASSQTLAAQGASVTTRQVSIADAAPTYSQGILGFKSIEPGTGALSLTLTIGGVTYSLADVGPRPAGDAEGAETYDFSSAGGGSSSLDFRHLDYTAFGSWTQGATTTAWVGGYYTPDAKVPTSGSATYAGHAYGAVQTTIGGSAAQAQLQGDASLSVDFAAGKVTGALTNMVAAPAAGAASTWNDVSITGTMAAGDISGATAAASAPPGVYAETSAATGLVSGHVYGPSAEEAGAIWDLSDGQARAVGTLAGKKK